MHSTRHDQVYHAAQCCQAASLSVTALSLRGLKRTCQVESPKKARFLASVECDQHELESLVGSASMLLLCAFKGRGLIRLLAFPDSIENAYPDIGQGTDGDSMALALSPLALVILLGPGFLERTLPGELVQRIAPELDSAQAAMGFLIRPALEENRRRASQSLQNAGIRVSAAVIALRPTGEEQDALPLLAKRRRARCRHDSKKGAQSPCRRRQFA
jgi:hypothetical protein